MWPGPTVGEKNMELIMERAGPGRFHPCLLRFMALGIRPITGYHSSIMALTYYYRRITLNSAEPCNGSLEWHTDILALAHRWCQHRKSADTAPRS